MTIKKLLAALTVVGSGSQVASERRLRHQSSSKRSQLPYSRRRKQDYQKPSITARLLLGSRNLDLLMDEEATP